MTNRSQPSGSLGSSERRSHRRQHVLLSWVELENHNVGTVLDVSERGLAIHTVSSIPSVPCLQIRFQLSQSDAWVEALGRIKWVHDSKHAAGMEFVDLPSESHVLLEAWISSIGSLNAGGRESEDGSKKALVLIRPHGSPKPEPKILFLKACKLVGLYLAVFMSPSALVVLNHEWGEAMHSEQGRDSTSLLGGSKRTPNSSSSQITEAPGVHPFVGPAFVIQVAAMKLKENADALAEILHEGKYPVFVIQRGSVPFYLVEVGPFDSADSARRVGRDLSNQGFEVILKRRSIPAEEVDP